MSEIGCLLYNNSVRTRTTVSRHLRKDGVAMKQKGVIYILTNPAFPQYVKIGYAQDLEKLLKQLNRSETIPYAFRAYAVYDV